MTNDINYSEFNMDCDNKCIDAMVIIFGIHRTINFFQCNARKCHDMFAKQQREEYLRRAEWYISKTVELQKIYSSEATLVCNEDLKAIKDTFAEPLIHLPLNYPNVKAMQKGRKIKK